MNNDDLRNNIDYWNEVSQSIIPIVMRLNAAWTKSIPIFEEFEKLLESLNTGITSWCWCYDEFVHTSKVFDTAVDNIETGYRLGWNDKDGLGVMVTRSRKVITPHSSNATEWDEPKIIPLRSASREIQIGAVSHLSVLIATISATLSEQELEESILKSYSILEIPHESVDDKTAEKTRDTFTILWESFKKALISAATLPNKSSNADSVDEKGDQARKRVDHVCLHYENSPNGVQKEEGIVDCLYPVNPSGVCRENICPYGTAHWKNHCHDDVWMKETNTPPNESEKKMSKRQQQEKIKEINKLTALTSLQKGCARIGVYPGHYDFVDVRMMTSQERQREYQQEPPVEKERTVARKAKSICPVMGKNSIQVGSIECHKCDGYVGVCGTNVVICNITE